MNALIQVYISNLATVSNESTSAKQFVEVIPLTPPTFSREMSSSLLSQQLTTAVFGNDDCLPLTSKVIKTAENIRIAKNLNELHTLKRSIYRKIKNIHGYIRKT